jgi:hypothetical protein
MRLSEERISALASKIARRLVKKQMALSTQNLRQLTAWIEKPILEDLAREEVIDEEVKTLIAGLQNKPPVGSFEYQALFQKKKEEVARRRGFKI